MVRTILVRIVGSLWYVTDACVGATGASKKDARRLSALSPVVVPGRRRPRSSVSSQLHRVQHSDRRHHSCHHSFAVSANPVIQVTLLLRPPTCFTRSVDNAIRQTLLYTVSKKTVHLWHFVITGSAVALHCCKAHAKINRKIENSTPCKIVTHEDFNLKLGTRDCVGDTTHRATLGSNRPSGGFPPNRGNITPM